MRIAILESIIMPAGHEVEFDRILVDELKKQGHTPCFFVPKRFPFKINYGVEIEYLEGGEVVTYAGVGELKKLLLSIVREKRRIDWFNAAYAKAKAGKCDAIIVPTSTYRYLRTLCNSKLKHSPVPIYFIFHGINPKEQPKFERQANKCLPYKNINLRVITLRNDFANSDLPNLRLINPPVFKPQDLPIREEIQGKTPIKIGFFGQFRKEKNLAFFLDAFVQANFTVPVELIVQGATAKPEDGEVFEKYAKDYAKYKNITFLHKNLIGIDWQKALLEVDVIIMPYAAERYRYHWSAMLFTAIGFYKPILISPEINPEVLAKYKIGAVVQLDSVAIFARQLEGFIDDFAKNKNIYRKNLLLANKEYSHEALIKNILDEN